MFWYSPFTKKRSGYKNQGDIGREKKKKAEERGKGVKGSRSNSKKMLRKKWLKGKKIPLDQFRKLRDTGYTAFQGF